MDDNGQQRLGTGTAQSEDGWLEARLGAVKAHRRARMELAVEPPPELTGQPRQISLSSLAETVLPHALRAVGMLRRGQANATRIQVCHNSVPISRLPAEFQGYTILHLTDLHADVSTGAMQALPQAIAGLRYDVCVITGDFRGQTFGPYEPSLNLIRQAVREIVVPMFGVLGNHDSGQMVRCLEDMGIQMLLNERRVIRRGSARLWLAGVDDPHHYRTDDVRKAMIDIPRAEPSVLLAHSTDCLRDASRQGVSLILCGHTHGGQICLPGRVPVLTSSAMPRRLASGAWKVGSLQGYTSRGIGTSALDVRFNCPPEVTLHTLVAGT